MTLKYRRSEDALTQGIDLKVVDLRLWKLCKKTLKLYKIQKWQRPLGNFLIEKGTFSQLSAGKIKGINARTYLIRRKTPESQTLSIISCNDETPQRGECSDNFETIKHNKIPIDVNAKNFHENPIVNKAAEIQFDVFDSENTLDFDIDNKFLKISRVCELLAWSPAVPDNWKDKRCWMTLIGG